MGPKPSQPQSGELFRPRLDEQINMQHPLVRLAALIDWTEIERTFAVSFTSGAGPSSLGSSPDRRAAVPAAHLRRL
jgi:IS5 family transposase